VFGGPYSECQSAYNVSFWSLPTVTLSSNQINRLNKPESSGFFSGSANLQASKTTVHGYNEALAKTLASFFENI